jgi:PPM family protein phosphatase
MRWHRCRGVIVPGPWHSNCRSDDVAGEPYNGNARRNSLSPLLAVDEFRPFSSIVRAEIDVRSHQGQVRQSNDDHYLVVRLAREQDVIATSLPRSDVPGRFEESGYAMLVADGIGDTGSGAVASRVALSSLAHLAIHFGRWNLRVDPDTASEIKQRAEWFYRRVDDAVVVKSRTDPLLTGMCTTLTAAYSAGDDLFVAHVGHSRAYFFRQGCLTQLTRDHTVSWQTAATGTLTAVDRATRDLQHILTDTIGGQVDGPGVDVDHVRLEDGDIVLLCTNGLTDMVSDNRISEVLALRRASGEQCQLLVDLALRAGGTDNVTVMIAQYRVPQP